MPKDKLNLKIAELEGLLCNKFPNARMFLHDEEVTRAYEHANRIGEELDVLRDYAAELENALPTNNLVRVLTKVRAHAKLLVELVNVSLAEDFENHE